MLIKLFGIRHISLGNTIHSSCLLVIDQGYHSKRWDPVDYPMIIIIIPINHSGSTCHRATGFSMGNRLARLPYIRGYIPIFIHPLKIVCLMITISFTIKSCIWNHYFHGRAIGLFLLPKDPARSRCGAISQRIGQVFPSSDGRAGS